MKKAIASKLNNHMSTNTLIEATATVNNPNSVIKPEILLSLATAPFLISILAAQSLGKTVIELGEATEELFRGERLPILHFEQETEE